MTKNRPRSIEAIRRFGFRSLSSSSNRRARSKARVRSTLPASLPEISKREIPSISARSQQLSLLSGGIRFPRCDNRSNKESCSCPFLVYDAKSANSHTRTHVHTHTHTHTHTDRSSYTLTISKNTLIWKKIYIYVYVYTYMYIYICIFLTYVHYVYIM